MNVRKNAPSVVAPDEVERLGQAVLALLWHRVFDGDGVDAELLHLLLIFDDQLLLHFAKGVGVAAGVAEHPNGEGTRSYKSPPGGVLAGSGGAADAYRPQDQWIDPVAKAQQCLQAQSLARVDHIEPLVDSCGDVHVLGLDTRYEGREYPACQLQDRRTGMQSMWEKHAMSNMGGDNHDLIVCTHEKTY